MLYLASMNEMNKYEAKAAKIIADAKAVRASGEYSGYSIDTANMSEIGKAVVGHANDFAVSAATRAESILRDGYHSFDGIALKYGHPDANLAYAAADMVAAAYLEMTGNDL